MLFWKTTVRLIIAAFGLVLISCSFSPRGAPAGSKKPPVAFLKFSAYAHDNVLVGSFSLANEETNQVAWGGSLRVQVYRTISLSPGGGGSAMQWKKNLYDNTFAIGVTNFHWERFGNFFIVKDLVCKFVVPYRNFQSKAPQGKVATLQIDLHPDNTAVGLSAKQNVTLY